MSEVDLSPDEGWEPLIRSDLPKTHSFVAGDVDPDRLQIVYYACKKDGQRRAKVWFGPHAEGPPGCAHGGSVAAVLDEAMGGNCWGSGHAVVAGTLTVRYRELVPLCAVHTVATRIERIEGRKVFASSTLSTRDGKLLAEGEGVFIQVRPEALARFQQAYESGTYRLPSDF